MGNNIVVNLDNIYFNYLINILILIKIKYKYIVVIQTELFKVLI